MPSVLYTQFKKEIAPALKKDLGLRSVMQVPKIKSVTVNVGFGRFAKDKSFIDNVVKTLTAISGQKPVLTKAKKINFKL